MAKNKEESRGAKEISGWSRAAVTTSHALGTLADQLGVPTAVFVLVLIPVYAFSKEQTRDDFIRMLLFGEVGDVWVRLFFAALVVTMVAAGMVRRRGMSQAEIEIGRLRKENETLQSKLLNPESAGPHRPALAAVPSDSQKDGQSQAVAVVK